MLLLSVKNLSVNFGDEAVLSNVNFEAKEGDVLAIIGPNGAGKTVLFKAILGLLPYRGTITWSKPPKIGYVPQRLKFDPAFPMTAEELFLLKARPESWLRREPERERIKTALDEVGMAYCLSSRIGALSAGEFQRVIIAYALFENPNVLLFDEPTAGIDIGAELNIYALINRIAEARDLTLLLISHDLNVVYEFADTVICLNRQMLCCGVPKEVLTAEQLEKLYGHHGIFSEHEHHHHV